MACHPRRGPKDVYFCHGTFHQVYLNYFDISSIYQNYYFGHLGKLVILQGRANHTAEEPGVELKAHNGLPCSNSSAVPFRTSLGLFLPQPLHFCSAPKGS